MNNILKHSATVPTRATVQNSLISGTSLQKPTANIQKPIKKFFVNDHPSDARPLASRIFTSR
ncbi:hypothetical protein T4C_8293 [Trichinella pseudospiralis]|uniref:Uncharacterized protein n=1 Tax=Trichinella pseudospiralis TaxID=6337 RepID=A0A0V1JE63_TRIPS|nr:hypothetical protein T4C_8293 [Trichinella pseudospiralis]